MRLRTSLFALTDTNNLQDIGDSWTIKGMDAVRVMEGRHRSLDFKMNVYVIVFVLLMTQLYMSNVYFMVHVICSKC